MTPRDAAAALAAPRVEADVVIVGSGPGGAAVARVLAEAGQRVLLVEEGPARTRFMPVMTHTNRYHMQEGGGMVALGSAPLPVAAGRGVGGGSLVNSAICFRTPDPVLQDWTRRLGDDRFGPAAMAPHFEEIEALIQVGPTSEAIAGENNLLIARGAAKLGLPGGLVRRNAPGCVGCAHCNYGCPVGGKASVDRNLLPLASAAGAQIQAEVKVDTILIEGGRARGVAGEVRDPDSGAPLGRWEARAPRVVICAGGIGTPRLLHHAGLGERLGPALGEGLHVHPGNAVLGVCDHEVRMWSGATQGAWFESEALPGVLPHTLSAPPGALLMIAGQVGPAAKAALAELPYWTGCVVMISDKGQGRVRATRDGRADLRYWFDPGDVERIKAGMRLTAEVLLAGGAREVFAPVFGTTRHRSAAALAEDLAGRSIQDFSLYASHPMASCRMGQDPSQSVVDPDGQAHGLPGLYVADSSVFPTSLGVNPQLTTMALATALARRWASAG